MDTKKIVSIVVAVVAAIAVICGGLFFWMNLPINKINKAMETENLEVVTENFGSLKEDDKIEVADKMRLYCQGISTDFMDERISYEDAMSKMNVLGEEVLAGDEAFNNMIESIELTNSSRVAWKSANEAIGAENYEKALEELEKVIPGDKNYEEAKKKIVECKEKILPDVVGSWTCPIDIGYALASIMGMASDDRFHFEIAQIYEFYEDGTGKRCADEEKLKETMDGFISLLVTVITEQYEEKLGISKAQLDKVFKQQYGMTMEKYLRSQANIEESFSGVGTTDEEFTYVVDGVNVIVTLDGNEFTFIREGKELLLDKLVDDATTSQLSDFHIELPMHFTKMN